MQNAQLRYILDTNVCVAFINGSNPNVVRKIMGIPPTNIAVCSIVEGELFYGAGKSKDPAKTRANQQYVLQPFVSLPFDTKSALVYGAERARLTLLGQLIGQNDLMIASIAIANNLILVTNNTREFSRVQGLTYEDWHSTP